MVFLSGTGQKYVIDQDGVDVTIKVLQFSIFLPNNDLSSSLRSRITGLLLNLLTDQEQLYPKVR